MKPSKYNQLFSDSEMQSSQVDGGGDQRSWAETPSSPAPLLCLCSSVLRRQSEGSWLRAADGFKMAPPGGRLFFLFSSARFISKYKYASPSIILSSPALLSLLLRHPSLTPPSPLLQLSSFPSSIAASFSLPLYSLSPPTSSPPTPPSSLCLFLPIFYSPLRHLILILIPSKNIGFFFRD